MKLRCYFLIFSLFSTALFGSVTPKLLSSSDVHKIMDQLFEYHVEHKQLNSEVIRRSLKIYVTQFDASHVYLLQEEVDTYVNPQEPLLKQMMADYDANQYETYFTLNQVICSGIERARQWRVQFASNPAQVIAEAKTIKDQPSEPTTFAKNTKELKARHKERFVRYVAFLMSELNYPTYDGVEKKVIELCEKQMIVFENAYLGIGESGATLSQEEQEHQIVMRTLKAFAHSLDAHTAYFSPEEAYAMKVQLEKGMCGIGVVLKEGIEGVIVHEMIKGGPAENSGILCAGDTIVEVDGQNVKGASFRHVLEVMRGKEGTKMTLSVMRPATHEFKRVTLTRSKISLDEQRVDCKAEPFADGIIGKITLHSFYEGEGGITSEQDIRRAVEQLKAQGPLYGVVLDMRDNSGGFLSQAIKVGGLFISNGVVVISKYSDGTIKYYRSLEDKQLFDGPLVVLVSRGSASATEIVAQALQDYGVAIVVGDEKTYGKGTIQHQTVTDDSSNSFFKVTIGRYYTVSGRSTQIRGVTADIVVPTPLHFVPIGENHLEYPLMADCVEPAFEDTLADVDPFARRWLTKNYLPNLQKRETTWIEYLPTLQENSERRLSQNKNFQIFLHDVKEKKTLSTSTCGGNDLQMEESVNILKDMIFLTK